jgi:hypothetical protein
MGDDKEDFVADDNVDEILAELDRELGLDDAWEAPSGGKNAPAPSRAQGTHGVQVVGVGVNPAPQRKATPLQLALQEVTNGAAKLDLGHYSIRVHDAGMEALAALLKRPSSQLSTVSLSSSDIGPKAAATLWAALEHNTKITKLDLTNNTKMGDEGATSMANALQSNHCLRWLDVENCGIQAPGGLAMAGALQVNKGLQSLHLSDNGLTDACATRLAEALAENTTLAVLWLDNNRIGAKGAAALAASLPRNKSLTTLHLGTPRVGASLEQL